MAKVPQRPELNALFKLPPKDAIAYLESKGFKIGWDWHETLDHAHSRAFTVAKVARVDLLQDIKSSLITALEKGQGLEQWKASIIPTLQEKGWWGKQTVINPAGIEQTVQLGSPRRLKTIFDTNVHKSLAAGRYKAMMASTETRPLWQWVHISITNPRRQHLARDGETRSFDDPFWQYAYPPTEWGCKCKVIARRDSDVDRLGLRKVETLPEDIEQQQVIVGKNSFTGQDAIATQTRIRIRQSDGQINYFTPSAGFNSHPASSYLLDTELTKRAANLVGNQPAIQQVQQMLLSPPRIKAHEAFVTNSLISAKPHNMTSTIGVVDMQDIQILTAKKIAVESPIVTVSGQLLTPLNTSNSLNIEEWLALPHLMQKIQKVFWDNDKQQMVFALPSIGSGLKVIHVAVQSKNGVMEVSEIKKVSKNSAIANFELIRGNE